MCAGPVARSGHSGGTARTCRPCYFRLEGISDDRPSGRLQSPALLELSLPGEAGEQSLFWPDRAPVPVEDLVSSLQGPTPEPQPAAAPADGQAAAQARVAEKRAARRATLEADRGIDAPLCTCGKPKVDAGHARWVCTNPDHPAGDR